jgi:hypothetical protein
MQHPKANSPQLSLSPVVRQRHCRATARLILTIHFHNRANHCSRTPSVKESFLSRAYIFMKIHRFILLLCVLLFGGTPSVRSAETDPIVAQFASALGYAEATSLPNIKNRLFSDFIGKSKQDVQVYIRRVIQNRGKLGAMKNGGRESRPDLLVLSHRSDLLQKVTTSLRVEFHYDSDLKVARIGCTST